jgi:serine/threonine-protein kinase
MGAVYEGLHVEMGKRVAIKTMSPALAAVPEARARFVLEAQLTSRVRHPHTVDVTDICTDGGQAFLVMEYLEGEDLARHLRRRGSLPLDEVVDIALPTLAAVATAHDEGIIHRDLKPQNLFLAEMPGGSLHPKVLDFGISKALANSPIKTSGMVLGSPIYFAPEQVSDPKTISPATDQYALGVILYECVTGRMPYEGSNLAELFNAIVQGTFPPPRNFCPDLPEAFEHIIVRAMRLVPGERYANLREMGRALLDFASEKTRLLWQDQFKPAAKSAATMAAMARSGPSPIPVTEQTPQAPSPSFVPLSDTLTIPRLPLAERPRLQIPSRWILPTKSPLPVSLDGRVLRRFRAARWFVGAGALAAAAWLVGFMMHGRNGAAPPVPAPVAAPAPAARSASAPPVPRAAATQAEAVGRPRVDDQAKIDDQAKVDDEAKAGPSPQRRGREHATMRRARFGPNQAPLIE